MPSNRKRKVAESKTKCAKSAVVSKKARMTASIKLVCSKKQKLSAKASDPKSTKTDSHFSKLKSNLKKNKRVGRKKTNGNHVSFSESIEIKTSTHAQVDQEIRSDDNNCTSKTIELKKTIKSKNNQVKRKTTNKSATCKKSPASLPVRNRKNETTKPLVDVLQPVNSASTVSQKNFASNISAERKDAIVQNDQMASNSTRFSFKDYDKPCTELAKFLLGKLLVYQTDSGCRVSGRIVETEAYLGGEDKASHSCGGKKTERIKAMYMPPGTSYVYNIYGVYACVNVSSRGDGAAVLIRSLEPVEGLELMKVARRSAKNKEDNVDKLKEHQLCNGPSKLTQALGITKANGDQVDLNTCKYLWIEDGENVDESKVVACSRIGIANYAQDWTDKPLRFYVKNNKSVSVRDKKAES